jgi:hypothetical protein
MSTGRGRSTCRPKNNVILTNASHPMRFTLARDAKLRWLHSFDRGFLADLPNASIGYDLYSVYYLELTPGQGYFYDSLPEKKLKSKISDT